MAKHKASEALAEGMSPGMVRAMVELGRYEDDCGLGGNDSAKRVPAPRVKPNNVVRLPVWPEAVRGVPNGVLRSALFGAVRRGPRGYMQAKPIASVEGVTVIFTGPRLDQADLDVWEQCLHLAQMQGLGCRILFSASGFLRAIGRNASGANHEWLKKGFEVQRYSNVR